MTFADSVYTAIETTLTKMPALYRYTETILKTFLISTNVQSWDLKDFFNREPIRRFVLTMTRSAGFLGAKRTKAFHYKKFGLSSIILSQNLLHRYCSFDNVYRQKELPQCSGSSRIWASWSWHSLFRLPKSLSDGVWSYQYAAGITRLPASRTYQRCNFN